jgi:dTDP-glucose 4,6-dehydratase
VKKSYMHAQDLAHAIWLMSEKAPLGCIYNVGPEMPSTIRHLVDLVAEESGVPFEKFVDITPGRLGEDAQYWLDSTRIKTDLGWREQLTLREGVRDMVAWGRKYLNQLPPPAEFVLRA